MYKKIFLPALLIVIVLSISIVAYAAYLGTPTPLSTNTVTQTNYPTATSTATVTTTGTVTSTSTIQPVEILTTTTVTGTQTYSTTVTTTIGATTTATATSTLSSDYYTPFYMYFTAYCPNPSGPGYVFCRSLTPFSLTYGSDSLTETASYTGPPSYAATATMTISQTSSTYYDLGFYYEFQNLNLGQLATGGYSIVISGSGNWGVNLWLTPEGFTWQPTGTPGVEDFVGLGTGSYGLGPSATSSATISGSTSIYLASGMGSCSSGSTETISQIVSTCGVSGSTPFALWVGVTGPSSAGTVTATINSIYSTPYP